MSAESERLVRGPRPGERPGGLGLTRMNFAADGDAAAVVDRARDVMLRLAGLPASAFNDVATGGLLPEWFLAAFARQPLAGQCPQDGDWTLEGWLYWADPGGAHGQARRCFPDRQLAVEVVLDVGEHLVDPAQRDRKSVV